MKSKLLLVLTLLFYFSLYINIVYAQNLTYRNIVFDKQAVIEGYKNVLRANVQNNITGFRQNIQFKKLDELLNERIILLNQSSIIEENSNFTTSPQTIGAFGFNDSGLKRFENDSFYSFMNKSVALNSTNIPQTPIKTPDDFYHFSSLAGTMTKSDFANNYEAFLIDWADAKNTPVIKRQRIKEAFINEIKDLQRTNIASKEVVGLDKDIALKLQAGDGDIFIDTLQRPDDVYDSNLKKVAGKLNRTIELYKLLGL